MGKQVFQSVYKSPHGHSRGVVMVSMTTREPDHHPEQQRASARLCWTVPTRFDIRAPIRCSLVHSLATPCAAVVSGQAPRTADLQLTL